MFREAMNIDFDIIFEKQRRGYTVYVPALPGCVSEGDTKESALRNITEAISLYLEEKGKSKAKRLANSIEIGKATIDAGA